MGLSFAEYKNFIDLTPYQRPRVLEGSEGKMEACDTLLKFLLKERGMIAAFNATYEKKRVLVRGYMNERPATPVPESIYAVQDSLLWTESIERGIVDAAALPEAREGVSLWQGDITRLKADAIVNAANGALLGCFMAGHNCIDNAIHSFAGMQLRRDCARIMAYQGESEACGDAKITRAYNLPATYVLHTVGPMVGRSLKEGDRAQLRACYLSCLDLAMELSLGTVAFCCISTGVFNFPQEDAAEIATGAVEGWRRRHRGSHVKVIFNTFLPSDTEIYREILS